MQHSDAVLFKYRRLTIVSGVSGANGLVGQDVSGVIVPFYLLILEGQRRVDLDLRNMDFRVCDRWPLSDEDGIFRGWEGGYGCDGQNIC